MQQRREPKNQKKKEFLQQYMSAVRDVETYRRMIDALRDDECRIKGITYTDMPKRKGVSGDLSDFAAELDELERDMRNALIRAQKKKAEVRRVILRQESAKEREILELRYLQDMTWKEIAAKAGYASDTRPREIHGAALEHLRWPE